MFKDPKFIAAIVTILAGLGGHFGLDIPEDTVGLVVGAILSLIYGKTAVNAVQKKIANKEKTDA